MAARTGPAAVRSFSYTRRLLHNSMLLGGAESLVLVGSLFLGGLIRFLWKGDPMFANWMWYLVVGWLCGTVILRLVPGWGLGPAEELRRLVLLLVAVFGGTTAMLFWGKAAQETSRFTLTTGLALSVVLVPLVRLRVKRGLLRAGQWGLPTVLYTDAQAGPRVVAALREEQGLGYQPIGLFTDDPGPHPQLNLPVLGTLQQSTPEAAAAVLALPGLPSHQLADLLEGPLAGYRRVVVIPDLTDAPSLWVRPRDLVGMLGLEIQQNLLDPLARITKRSFDLAFTLFTAPFWAPLCALLGLLIWLEDRRSPLFRQERMGLRRRPFTAWKFRTMHPDAEALLRQRLEVDADLRAEWAANFKLRRDPRITPIGRFLRRTSLDELPQMVNVLRGEMSLVGPRPLPPYHFDELPERVKTLRDRVRPGLTGLWQVSGRSETGHAGMARWDTYYVRNWSFWLDIIIFFRTARAVLTGHGAF
jgi:Undecaprenyl-phosphate galactose phosphotransferase WbaP